MGVQAIRNCIADWGGSLSEHKRIALVAGSGLGLEDQLAPGFPREEHKDYLSTLAEKLKLETGMECEAIYIGNACSAGSHAISYGMDLLEEDCFDLVIAGGMDALSQMAYKGFLRLNAIDPEGCRPFDRDRKGIMVGEGAVFFMLQKSSACKWDRGRVYCALKGAGVTNDAYNVVQMKADGQQIIRAMEEALDASGLGRDEIDLVVAHGTGTILNDRNEAKIIHDFFDGQLEHVLVTAPKGAIGHTGGASGGFGLLTAIGSMLYGYVPPIYNLKNPDPDIRIPLVEGKPARHCVKGAIVNAFAFGGTNVVLVCEKRDTGCSYG